MFSECALNCCCNLIKEKIQQHTIKLSVFSVLVGILVILNALQFGQGGYYTAAVVEYHPVWNDIEQTEALILHNARRYVKIIETASEKEVDIIVFPEFGLTTTKIPKDRKSMSPFLSVIPNVDDECVPCTEGRIDIAEHIRAISCAAQAYKLYVVVNTYEKYPCNKLKPGCPEDGVLIFNTNVAFDRNGRIVAKYHKYNLFNEDFVNTTSTVQISTFETDFDVTFGMFTSFDILFYEPAIKILEGGKIRNIIYPSAWLSELPFLTSTQVQASYSLLHNIQLLAAGYNEPAQSYGGSGFYTGWQGPSAVVMPKEIKTVLLITKMSKDSFTRYQKCRNIYEYYCLSDDSDIIEIKFDDNHFQNNDKNILHNVTNMFIDQVLNAVNLKYPNKESSEFIKKLSDDNYNKTQNTTSCSKNKVSPVNSFKFIKEDITGFFTILLNDHVNNKNVETLASEVTVQTKFTYKFDNFTCRILVNWTKSSAHENDTTSYRLVAYNGVRKYPNNQKVNLEVCAVIACYDRTLSSCGLLPNFQKFNLINITSILIDIKTRRLSNVFGSSLNKDILPLSGYDMSVYTNVNNITKVLTSFMVLEKSHDDLITFGIYKQE